MNDDDEIVPTSDPEEAYEISMRLTMPKEAVTTVFNNNLAVNVPARKRPRLPKAPEWVVEATPSPPPSRQATPLLSPSVRHARSRNTTPGPSAPARIPAHIKEEEDQESQDPLDLFDYEDTPAPESGHFWSSSSQSVPPPSMTPISERNLPHSSPEGVAMQSDHSELYDWTRQQSSTPALTPDKRQPDVDDDLMDFGDTETVRPITPSTPPQSQHWPTARDSSLSPVPSSPPRPPSPPPGPAPADELPNIPLETRYSLRTRLPIQDHPYKLELLRYQRTLKDHPDAVVGNKQIQKDLRRQRNDEQYEQETQEDDLHDEGRLRAPAQRRSQSKPVDIPLGLEPLPDFDEEDLARRREMKEATKEAAKERRRRQLEEQEEARRREEEQEEARRQEEEARRRVEVHHREEASEAEASKIKMPRQSSINESFRSLSISPQKANHRSRQRSSSRRIISPSPRRRRSLSLRSSRSPSRMRSPSPFADAPHQTDIEMNEIEFPPSRNTSPQPLANEENISSEEDVESPSDAEPTDPRLNILMKMYPAFMLKKLSRVEEAKKRAAYRKRRSSQKARKSATPKPPAKILGDPESSEEERQPIDPNDDLLAFGQGPSSPLAQDDQPHPHDQSDNSEDDHDNVFSYGRAGPGPSTSAAAKARRAVITISDESSTEELVRSRYISDAGDVSSSDNDALGAWPVLRGKEPDAIDYMLVRPVRAAATSQSARPRKHRHAKTSVAKGKGREVQSKLTNWGGHTKSIKRRQSGRRHMDIGVDDTDEEEHGYVEVNPTPRPAGSRKKAPMLGPSEDADDEDPSPQDFAVTSKDSARKGLEKRRKQQRAKNGVYVVTGPAGLQRTTRGHDPRSADLELEVAIPAPRREEGSMFVYGPRGVVQRPEAQRASSLDMPGRASSLDMPGSDMEGDADINPEPLPTEVDVDVKKLTFSPATFVGKGWLFELFPDAAHAVPVPEPVFVVVGEIGFSSNMSVDQFLQALRSFWATLFEAVTGLPDDTKDIVTQSSVRLCRSAASSLSHLLRTEPVEMGIHLKAGVESQIQDLHRRMCTPQFRHATDDPALRVLLWLPLELAVRIGLPVPTPATEGDNVIKSLAVVLIEHLLRRDLPATMCSVSPKLAIDQPFHPVELWLCLFYVLRPASTKDDHIIWTLLEAAIVKSGTGDLSPMAMSERLWDTIHMLGDLFKFSLHGRFTSDSYSFPCWNMVLLALSSISLSVLPEDQNGLPKSHFALRERYFASIVRRCTRLAGRYGWPLGGIFKVVMHLGKAFKARKFASLSHEGCNYPRFVRQNNWDGFSSFRRGDTAYITFLKLVVQSVPTFTPIQQKKVVSNSFATAKFAPANDGMSSLTNRFIGISAAIVAMPDTFEDRIKQAQLYVDFKASDDNARWTAIQGFIFIAFLLIRLDKPLESLSTWLQEIVVGLKADCRARQLQNDLACLFNPKLLARGIFYIFGAYEKVNSNPNRSPRYPSTTILSQVLRISETIKDDNDLRADLMRVNHAFFRARATALPARKKPDVLVVEEESQDAMFAEFDDEFELDCVADNWEAENAVLVKLFRKEWWLPFRFVVDDAPPNDRNMDVWLETLANSLLLVPEGETLDSRWNLFAKKYDDSEKPTSPAQKEFIHRRLMYFLLKADPDAYASTLRPVINNMVFQSLVPREFTVEIAQFVSVILDLDQRRREQVQPIFSQVPFQRERNQEYDIAVSDFEELAPDMIEGLFSEVNNLIADKEVLKADTCLEPLLCMFSRMRELYAEHPESSGTETASPFIKYCRKIIDKAREHDEFLSYPKLSFWVEWFEGISPR